MSGLSSTKTNQLKNFVTPRQQQAIKQKNERRKFLVAIILSNLLTLLMAGYGQAPKQEEERAEVEKDIAGYTRISLGLKLFVPRVNSRQIVGVYNKEGKLIIPKAFLESLPLNSNKEGSWQSLNQLEEYLIWVPENKVSKLTLYSQDELMVYPFNEGLTGVAQSKNTQASRKSYELTF